MEEQNTVDCLGPIVATADAAQESNDAHASLEAAIGALEGRVRDLETKLQHLQSVRASAEQPATGRKTVPASQVSLLAKGVAEQPSVPQPECGAAHCRQERTLARRAYAVSRTTVAGSNRGTCKSPRIPFWSSARVRRGAAFAAPFSLS